MGPTPHELKSMAKVQVGGFVDASTLWICNRKTGMRCSTGLMIEKSELLLKNMQPWERKLVNPKLNEIVGVRDPQTNRWHRGRVVNIDSTQKYPEYELFLIDYGSTLKVQNHDLCAMNTDFQKIPPLAIKLCMFGIVPVQVDLFTMVSPWSNAANSFVSRLVDDMYGAYVVPKAADELASTMYGDLYFLSDKKLVSLSELLINEGFAKRDKELFAERYNLALRNKNAEGYPSNTVDSLKDLLAPGMNGEVQGGKREEQRFTFKKPQPVDESGSKAAGKKTFNTPLRTFYPAGFCMDEADKMLKKLKDKEEEERKKKARGEPSHGLRQKQKDENPSFHKVVSGQSLCDESGKYDLGENPYFPIRKSRQPSSDVSETHDLGENPSFPKRVSSWLTDDVSNTHDRGENPSFPKGRSSRLSDNVTKMHDRGENPSIPIRGLSLLSDDVSNSHDRGETPSLPKRGSIRFSDDANNTHNRGENPLIPERGLSMLSDDVSNSHDRGETPSLPKRGSIRFSDDASNMHDQGENPSIPKRGLSLLSDDVSNMHDQGENPSFPKSRLSLLSDNVSKTHDRGENRSFPKSRSSLLSDNVSKTLDRDENPSIPKGGSSQLSDNISKTHDQGENRSFPKSRLSLLSDNVSKTHDQGGNPLFPKRESDDVGRKHDLHENRSLRECDNRSKIDGLPYKVAQVSSSSTKDGLISSRGTTNIESEDVSVSQNVKRHEISARIALLLKSVEDVESIAKPTAKFSTSNTEKCCAAKKVSWSKVNENCCEEAPMTLSEIKKPDNYRHENSFEVNCFKRSTITNDLHEDDRMRSLPPPSEERTTTFSQFDWGDDTEGMRNSFISRQTDISYLLHGAQRPKKHRRANFVSCVAEVLIKENQGIPSVYESVWSLILQRRNIVTVNTHCTGKRMAYLPPLIHFLVAEKNENEIPNGHGPVLLILTSGSSGVNAIEHLCQSFLRKKDVKITVINGGDGKSAKTVQVELLNGCHILISTPLSFVRVLAYGERFLSFNRLRYFVLDEADNLVHRYHEEVKFILLKLTDALKRKRAVDSFQIVVSAEKWVRVFVELVEKIPSPVIIISSFAEAAAYAEVKPRVHLLNSSQKLSTLIDLLKNSGSHKTVVVCSNNEVSSIVGAVSQHVSENVLVVPASMTLPCVHAVVMRWYSSANRSPILICCDDLFQELKIEDASHLVHYSLPDTKQRFDNRFSVLLQNLRNILEKKTEKGLDLLVDIFINETDNMKLPFLVSFLKRLNVPVHCDLETRSELAVVQKENNKSVIPLCTSIISFGKCWNTLTCHYRHTIINNEKSSVVPMLSTVKVQILDTCSACQFRARILEWTDPEGNRTPVHNRHMEVTMKLQNFFKHDDNKCLVGDPEVYGIYAREGSGNTFKRTQIVADAELDRNGRPVEVYFCDIDDGNKDRVKVSQLYELPDELKNIPRQSVELVLCNLCPVDKDWTWTRAACSRVKDMLQEVELEGRYLQGKVRASLANCVWIEPLSCYQTFTKLKTTYEVFSLRSRIIKEGLAIDNPSHLKCLYDLFKECGISVREEETQPVRVSKLGPRPQPEEKFNPQWAFLPSDEFHSVSFITGDDPGRFFVRCTKFEVLLENLSKKISKFVKDREGEQASDNSLAQRDFCIARFEDGNWCRARVRKIEDDNVDVYFVDYGDVAVVKKSEVLRAPAEIFTQLPFQAIECELACIHPAGECWSDKAYEILFDHADDPDLTGLYAKVLRKQQAECTGGWKYSVLLISTKAKDMCVVNQLLIDEGVARQSLEEKSFVDETDLSEIVWVQTEDDEKKSEEEDDEREAEEGDDEREEEEEDDDRELVEDRAEHNSELQSELAEPLLEKTVQIEGDSMINFANLEDEECWAFFRCCQNETQPTNTPPTNMQPLPWKESDTDDSASSENNEREDSASFGVDSNDSGFSDGTGRTPMPRLVHTIRHPLVIWRQDFYNIWLEIDVCGVEDYLLQAEPFKLSFCTQVDGELYGFVMNLWGSINPDKVVRKAGGLRFHVKLYKLHIGIEWDQLLQHDKKVSWLRYDVNAVTPKTGEEADDEEKEEFVKEVVQKAREAAPECPEFVKPGVETSSDEEEEGETGPIEPFLFDRYDPFF